MLCTYEQIQAPSSSSKQDDDEVDYEIDQNVAGSLQAVSDGEIEHFERRS
jgi:hypothetical protein